MDAEKENTFRALRDQELLVTSRWCRFGFHRWTKWRKHSASGSVTFKAGSIVRKYVFERCCVHCNKIDRNLRRLYEETHTFDRK